MRGIPLHMNAASEPARRRAIVSGLDLAMSGRSSDAARESDHAVMLQYIGIERVDLRIINIRRQHALAQIIQDHYARGSAQSAKSPLMQFGPNLRAGAEHKPPDGF